MASTNNAMPLIEQGYNNGRGPGQAAGDPQAPDGQPGSHHALNTAYNDLKKRYNDLEQKNKHLIRKLKEIQRSGALQSSPLSSADITPTTSRESSPQLLTGIGGAYSANGALAAAEESVNLTLQQLEHKLLKVQEHEQELIDEKLRLTDRCRDVEKANATLSGENNEIKQTQHSLLSHLKARENDLLDKKVKLEKENEQHLRKNISLEKRLKFLEKQLIEQKQKNNHLEEEYLLSKSELQDDVSHVQIGDESESVIEELKSTVSQYHLELRDLYNVVCDQKSLIGKLVSREANRKSLLCGHRRHSRDSSALSNATSHGARPKTSQRSPSYKSKQPPAHVEVSSESRDQGASGASQRDTLNPYDGVVHDKYHRRSASQGSHEARSMHSSSGKNGTEADKSYNEFGNPSYKYEAMSNWLGQLHMARNDSLEHLNDLQDDDDVFGNLDILDNLDDNMVPEQEYAGGKSGPGLSVQSGATVAARPSHFASSTLPRQSHRLMVQEGQGTNAGNSLNVQSTRARSASRDRPDIERESRRSSDVRSPNSELENRYRPNSASQQPRPLNIERNEDVTNSRRSYDNTTQNINLNVQTDKDRPERPDNLILNNDPLVGHKVIPNRNIYQGEEIYLKEGRQVAVTPGDAMHTCPICNVDFPASTSMEEFQQHVLDCCDSTEQEAVRPLPPALSEGATLAVEARVCPVCNTEFPYLIDQKDFEDHVLGHFEEEERRSRFEMTEP